MTTVSAEYYLAALTPIIEQVSEQAAGPIQRAADLIAASLRADGVVQAFGTGHSEALAMEVAGRAGGLVPTNRISLRDLVIFGGRAAEDLSGGELERDPQVAQQLYDLAKPHPADVFVIASNSGVNGAIVEMARLVKSRGHALIAITSLAHTAGVESRHPGGTKLVDHADVILDNGAPHGDAVLEMPGGGRACAVSSVTAAMLAQMLGAETIRRLIEADVAPPVYLSANIPGGDEHNRTLEQRYAGRIRRTA
ncbi:MAG: SIS domain-containing protein [Nocardioidaceae bacterium]|nr:SIS domain-containing protein [Nocardioidaceae bacterium]